MRIEISEGLAQYLTHIGSTIAGKQPTSNNTPLLFSYDI
jgi:hypothetical protein